MEKVNYINIIFELIISIVAPLLVAYLTNQKTKDESKFFSYITLSEENFVKKTKRKSNILMVIFLMLHCAVGLNGTLYSLPINESISEKAGIVGLIVLTIVMSGQFFCIYILSFSDIEYLDEKMRKQKRDLSDMDEWINNVITIICVMSFIIMYLCRKNADTVSLIAYLMLLTTIGLEAVYNSFVSLYVKVRRWYHVEEIIIKTKTNKNVYKNLFNYRKKSDMYEFLCEEEKLLKRFSIPADEIESIEKVIDATTTYLDTVREKQMGNVQKKNKKGRIVHEFVSQNKAIVMTGICALIYCIVCVVFKSSTVLNVNKTIYPWAEFFFNVAISVIAALIFFVVQVYIPNRKKEQVLRKYAKRHIKDKVLIECDVLKSRTELLRKGEKKEAEMKAAINSSCKKIKQELNEVLNKYLQVLSEELIEALNSVLNDDMLYMLSVRANGELVNLSMEKIVQDSINYQWLWKKVEQIRTESEKI